MIDRTNRNQSARYFSLQCQYLYLYNTLIKGHPHGKNHNLEFVSNISPILSVRMNSLAVSLLSECIRSKVYRNHTVNIEGIDRKAL